MLWSRPLSMEFCTRPSGPQVAPPQGATKIRRFEESNCVKSNSRLVPPTDTMQPMVGVVHNWFPPRRSFAQRLLCANVTDVFGRQKNLLLSFLSWWIFIVLENSLCLNVVRQVTAKAGERQVKEKNNIITHSCTFIFFLEKMVLCVFTNSLLVRKIGSFCTFVFFLAQFCAIFFAVPG